jgi:hypothetical protein
MSAIEVFNNSGAVAEFSQGTTFGGFPLGATEFIDQGGLLTVTVGGPGGDVVSTNWNVTTNLATYYWDVNLYDPTGSIDGSIYGRVYQVSPSNHVGDFQILSGGGYRLVKGLNYQYIISLDNGATYEVHAYGLAMGVPPAYNAGDVDFDGDDDFYDYQDISLDYVGGGATFVTPTLEFEDVTFIPEGAGTVTSNPVYSTNIVVGGVTYQVDLAGAAALHLTSGVPQVIDYGSINQAAADHYSAGMVYGVLVWGPFFGFLIAKRLFSAIGYWKA